MSVGWEPPHDIHLGQPEDIWCGETGIVGPQEAIAPDRRSDGDMTASRTLRDRVQGRLLGQSRVRPSRTPTAGLWNRTGLMPGDLMMGVKVGKSLGDGWATVGKKRLSQEAVKRSLVLVAATS
ncbi:hypothetical protein PAAG_11468 [Paracoccidioides lutzii Pb01]|uniref:Uncharacterized protein n=1 Tax=Paracoccidioides lutzii (strain ATCC MYA-826 / Pb01) TaxID=502779 RepID=A0A0A2V6M5_PARBA|nr:hypothetical protein PAAG_11468 [Paracoccidioides lutzii Pb01]KGQ01750.1 hypothetical protein PAAG_11468 [Paracoccidioides lutzii Pb01]